MGFLSRLLGAKPQQQPLITAVVQIPQVGTPNVSWTPQDAEPDDLGLMALCYASKIGWLVEIETQVKPLFWALAQEAKSLDGSDLTSDDFLSLLPTAKGLRAKLQDGDRSVPGGEVFSVEFLRKAWTEPGGSPRQMGVVANHLPEPGLAPNIPWSAFLLQSAVWSKLDMTQRTKTVSGWDAITKLLTSDGGRPTGDQRHLQLLFMLVTAQWISVAA